MIQDSKSENSRFVRFKTLGLSLFDSESILILTTKKLIRLEVFERQRIEEKERSYKL